ncbi:hypothetical protein QQ045_007852 [Rhodiola kirilowii]
MNHITNVFSLLELDAEDDRVHVDHVQDTEDTEKAGRGKHGGAGSSNGTLDTAKEGQRQYGENLTLPLAWIDLEMTGLDVENDRILEIACIMTNGSLSKSIEGPDLVIHQSQACLDKMGAWCQTHHGASGLTKRVLQSTITEHEAEKQVIKFVKEHIGDFTPLLAGNSVYVDLLFLKVLFCAFTYSVCMLAFSYIFQHFSMLYMLIFVAAEIYARIGQPFPTRTC